MGDAMVFDARVLRAHGWLTESLTEDREYGYELVLRGIRPVYVPHARSYGQGASSWRQAKPQRLRWYQAVVAMQRRFAGRLLAAAARRRSLTPLDAALELLMPSYSFLAAASLLHLALLWLLSLLLPPPSGNGTLPGILSLPGAGLVAVAWILYPILGLVADRAPRWAFRSILIGPAYLIWRLWISLLVRLRRGRIAWVRTRRRDEIGSRSS
jgi:cellulose synthase/poly-beta-1,6-N-acetylglucosamine synthase-like glycosyltransferase